MAFNGIESPDRPIRPPKHSSQQISPIPIDDVDIPPAKSEDEEDRLLCHERLELSSPILWPEQVQGLTHFMANLSPAAGEDKSYNPEWQQEFTSDEFNMLVTFGAMSEGAILDKIKEFQNLAYELGLEESKEMARGNLLDVFGARS